MARAATLNIRILADAKGAVSGMGQVESRADRMGRRLDGASVAAGGAVAALVGLGLKAQEAASALQQSSGAVETVFGATADAIKATAAAAADSVGLSASAYQDLAAGMGSQLKNLGIAQDQLAPKTQELIGLGADLAATYGGTTADAVAALSSLMRGETDPIERYGVSIKAADIAAQLAASGQDKLTGAAAKAAQAQAVLGLISGQTAAAQGAAAREADTDASAQQRMAAQAENAAAALGAKLLPITTAVQQALAGLAVWVSQNSTLVLVLAGVVGGLAVATFAVNGALRAYRAAALVATAAQAVWNAAMAANPLGLVVLAIAAVVGAAVLLYQKFQPVREIVDTIGSAFGSAFDAALGFIQPVIDAVQFLWDKLQLVGDVIGEVGGFLFGAPSPGAARAVGSAQRLASPLRTASSGGTMLGTLGGVTGGRRESLTSTAQTVIQVKIDGALDPVAVGRQVDSVLRRYSTTTGRTAYALGASA